jgi:hypothetical protein
MASLKKMKKGKTRAKPPAARKNSKASDKSSFRYQKEPALGGRENLPGAQPGEFIPAERGDKPQPRSKKIREPETLS